MAISPKQTSGAVSGELIVNVRHCREDYFNGLTLNVGTLHGLYDFLGLPTYSRTPTKTGLVVRYVSDLLCNYPERSLGITDALTLHRNLLRWFASTDRLSQQDLQEVLKLCKEFPGRCAIEKLKG